MKTVELLKLLKRRKKVKMAEMMSCYIFLKLYIVSDMILTMILQIFATNSENCERYNGKSYASVYISWLGMACHL